MEKLLATFMKKFLQKTAIDAIALSSKLLEDWLGTCMFNGSDANDIVIIKNIVSKLNEHDDSLTHGRHFDIKFCKSIGLKIIELESDPKLQDAVLSVHHAFMHTMASTPAVKIIENSHGRAWINSIQ